MKLKSIHYAFISVISSIFFFISCNKNSNKDNNYYFENEFSPYASQRNILTDKPHQSSSNDKLDRYILTQRDEKCSDLTNPEILSKVNSIVSIRGSLFASSENNEYSYQFEKLLNQTKSLIDDNSCFYPEVYLANASLLLRLSELPTDLVNSESKTIAALDQSNQIENNFTEKKNVANSFLKYSKFAKLNSIIRQASNAQYIIDHDMAKGKYKRIFALNGNQKPIYLFESNSLPGPSGEDKRFDEAYLFSNYLLAKAFYERAQYRLQGIVSSDDLYEIVPIPNENIALSVSSLNEDGTAIKYSVREIIARDFHLAKIFSYSFYKNGYCTETTNRDIPAHMGTLCGDLKKMFGDDLSLLENDVESLPKIHPFYIQMTRLECTADERYKPIIDEWIPIDDTKLCEGFLNENPNLKGTNLSPTGLNYSNVNPWALNLAGAAQHLNYLDSSLGNVLNNITQNKENILKMEDTDKKINELNFQKSSLINESTIAQNKIITAQNNVIAQQAAVGSAQSGESALKNQLTTVKLQQGNLFRQYLSNIRKKQYLTILKNSVSLNDAQKAVEAFIKTVKDNAPIAKHSLENQKLAIAKTWASGCIHSVSLYNSNIESLKNYQCIASVDPAKYWNGKDKWNDALSNDFKNKMNDILKEIQGQVSNGCNAAVIAAVTTRASQLIHNGDRQLDSSWSFTNYARDLSNLSNQKQTAIETIAQITAIQAQYAMMYGDGTSSTSQKIPASSIPIENYCIEKSSTSAEVQSVLVQIAQNDISTASQIAASQISLNNLEQERRLLENNLAEINTQISSDSITLSINKQERLKYENNALEIYNYTQDQIDFEVNKYINLITDQSPVIKALKDQISAANYEIIRAKSLLDAASSELNTTKMNLSAAQNNIAQIDFQITNWNMAKDSFVFSSLSPTVTSYKESEYLLEDARESAHSLLKVLAFRTMNFEQGQYLQQNYPEFIRLLNLSQKNCRYFASFGDAKNCILSLRKILDSSNIQDPNVPKLNYGLYGTNAEILPVEIYSDDYYSSKLIEDSRTAEQATFNNQFIQNLRLNGFATLAINPSFLIREFDQGADPEETFSNFGSYRVLGISINIYKNENSKPINLFYSQENNKFAVLHDGLNGFGGLNGDCTQANLFAKEKSKMAQQSLANLSSGYKGRFQNLMSPGIIAGILCQKITWLEKPQANSIPEDILIREKNVASKNWFFNLVNKTKHNYRPFFKLSDGSWNLISGVINPDSMNVTSNYSNSMLGCIKDAIQNPNTSNLNLVSCNQSPINSSINFTNIAGSPLMGTWNFVYGEYGADLFDYKNESIKKVLEENLRTKILGVDITFYIIKN